MHSVYESAKFLSYRAEVVSILNLVYQNDNALQYLVPLKGNEIINKEVGIELQFEYLERPFY